MPSGPPPAPAGFSQQEIFEHELAVAPRQRAAAGAARYLAIDRFRSGLGFDNLVKCVAVRTSEGIERRWSSSSHTRARNVTGLSQLITAPPKLRTSGVRSQRPRPKRPRLCESHFPFAQPERRSFAHLNSDCPALVSRSGFARASPTREADGRHAGSAFWMNSTKRRRHAEAIDAKIAP